MSNNRLLLEDKLDNIEGVLEDINATLQGDTSNPVYGIKRSLTSITSAWVRTDSAVGLSALATKDGSDVDNDFDSIYPWSDIISVNIDDIDEIVACYGDDNFAFDGSNGDVMTYIPNFFFKRWQKDGYEYVQIARHHFAGAMEIEPFYIGRYNTSSGVHSYSGVTSTVSQNIATFRTQAMSKGEKWSQLDWRLFAIQMLYLVEYADGDSQSMLGQGVCSASAQVTSGQCDGLGMKSGCYANAGATSMIYRGVENIYGNIWQFVDGINIKDGQAWVCYDHEKYVSDTFAEPYQALGYVNATANGNPNQMGCDENNMLIGIPSKVGTSVYGDYYWYASGNKIVFFGGTWVAGANDGFFCLPCDIDSSRSSAYIGGRLLRTH